MSDADTTALVAMLRQIQCEPASFDTYSMASAAERAADAIERLRSPGGARVEPGDDPAVLREHLRIYGGHIPPCAGRPCECGFAKAWQVSRLPEPSRGVDTAALNRELCEKEGHVLGVVARPCLRCHEWFDPQYGRAPEPGGQQT